MKQFIATKACLFYNGKLLILRESGTYVDGANEGKWNAPGGRVEPGQHFMESLKRELHEECGLDVVIGDPIFVGEWHPVVRGEAWQIIGAYFMCEALTDVVTLSEDHDDYKWITLDEMKDYTILKPDDEAFAKAFAYKK